MPSSAVYTVMQPANETQSALRHDTDASNHFSINQTIQSDFARDAGVSAHRATTDRVTFNGGNAISVIAHLSAGVDMRQELSQFQHRANGHLACH